MTIPTRNAGDGGSFFQAQQTSPSNDGLIKSQLDPSIPQIPSLVRISDPIIPTQHSSINVNNFDPDLYNLDPSSHLMRFIKALVGAAGTGGLRKQVAVARMSANLAGTNFVDLDAFYGALFGMTRDVTELMPTNTDGSTLNPMTDVAPADVWDSAQSADSRYRSRIYALARAINMGATLPGLRAVAEAILNISVDIFESWVKVDLLSSNQISATGGFQYGYIKAQFVTYHNINSLSYNYLEGSQFGAGNTPTGNRGEVIFTPRRIITQQEAFQLAQVLRVLKPSGIQITISSSPSSSYAKVPALNFYSDSENWTVVSQVNPNILINQGTSTLYPQSTSDTSSRPAFSAYEGEAWTYNPSIVKVSSYELTNDNLPVSNPVPTDQTVAYADGVVHTYVASDAVMDTYQALAKRTSADGVMTAYPYQGNRPNYGSS